MSSQNDPHHHTRKIKGMIDDLIRHVREDVHVVGESKAQALFGTTAEVLSGLKTAYSHYEEIPKRVCAIDGKTQYMVLQSVVTCYILNPLSDGVEYSV